jgi:glyoxylase-like metal-dependent hydrolase (beta-lactamase superfamily II)
VERAPAVSSARSSAEVAPGVFRIRLPLPFRLEHVNLYVVDTGSGFVLVDTGVRTRDAVAAFDAGLAALGIAPTELIAVVVTHFHVDHVGQAGRLARKWGRPIYMSAVDVEMTARMAPAARPPVEVEARRHGVPDELAAGFGAVLDAAGTLVEPVAVTATLADGAAVPGARGLTAHLTPGHTPGHLCVGLEAERLLFGGDHILPGISPHIGVYDRDGGDVLGSYLQSLARVLALAPRRILPAHGDPIDDPASRIRELLRHHDARLDRTLAAVPRAGASAWMVTREVFTGPAADRDDLVGQFLAFTESLAHLEHLAGRGALRRVDARYQPA